jgi:hypothetical protein
MLTPYRVESNIDKYVPKKYGLIKKPGGNPWRVFLVFQEMFVEIFASIKIAIRKHHCAYPKHGARIWHWVKGSPFAPGSVYRCSCGNIWESDRNGKWHWESDKEWAIRRWVDAGGEE